MNLESKPFKAKLECLIPQPAITDQVDFSLLDSIKRPPMCFELENSDGTITPETLLKYDVTLDYAAQYCMNYNIAKQDESLQRGLSWMHSKISNLILQLDLDGRDPDLVIYDLKATVIMAFHGVLLGYGSVVEWVETFNNSPTIRGSLSAITNTMIAPPYEYRVASVYRMLSMFSDAYYADRGETHKACTTQSLYALFRELQMDHLNSMVPPCVYQPTHGFLEGMSFEFSESLFITVGWDGQELRASYLSHDASSKRNYATVNMFACTFRLYLDFRIKVKKNHERFAFEEMLTYFRQYKFFSKVVFICDNLNTTSDIERLIINSGANYMMPLATNNGNKPVLQRSKDIMQANVNSPALHFFDNYTNTEHGVHGGKGHGRIEHVQVKALSRNNSDVNGDWTAILNKYPSAQSIVFQDKVKEEVRNNYSKEALAKLNAGKDTSEEWRKNHQRYVTNLDVDQPEIFDQVLCILNKKWLYESGHYVVDENLGQDRRQITGTARIITRVGFNKISYNFTTSVRDQMFERAKSIPAGGAKTRNASRPPSYRQVYTRLRSCPLEYLHYLAAYSRQHLKQTIGQQSKLEAEQPPDVCYHTLV